MTLTPLDLLPAEYQATLARLHRVQDSLPLVGGAALLVSAGAAAYAIGNRAALNAGYAWAAPLPFLAGVALVLALLSQRASALCRLEELRQQAQPGNLPLPDNPYAPFLVRWLALPIAGALALYGLTLFVSWRALHNASPLSATLFSLTYFSLTLAVAFVGWAVRRQALRQAPLSARQVQRALLPYPQDLMVGLGLMTAGWLYAWLTPGFNLAQLPLLDSLLRRNELIDPFIPLSAVAALGFFVFLVFEGLLVPTGRLWQEARAARAGSGDPGEIQFTYAHIFIRLALALPLAYGLGGMPLLILALLIWLQMAAGALLVPVEPGMHRSAPRARAALLWGALLAPLRFFAGVLVWVGPDWSFSVLLLLFCVVAFLALGLSAARQARAARLLAPHRVLPPGDLADAGGDPGLAYDLRSVPRWQRAGFLAAGLTALALVILQVLAENPDFTQEWLANGYGFRVPNGAVAYHQVGLVNSLLLVFDLLFLGLLACALVVRLLGRSKARWVLLAERIRPAGLAAFGMGAAVLFLAAFGTGLTSLAMAALLLFVLAAALWAER